VKTLLVSCDLRHIKSALRQNSQPSHYIDLICTPASRKITAYLEEYPATLPLDKSSIFRTINAKFTYMYSDFMSQLNAANYSLKWWVLPFTNKNPLATNLYRNVFEFMVVSSIFETTQETIIVITDNKTLKKQIAYWARTKNIKILQTRSWLINWKPIIRRYTCLPTILAFAKSLSIWFCARRFRPSNQNNEYHLICTLFHENSFIDETNYRDVYFPNLSDEFHKLKLSVITCGLIQESWSKQLSKIAKFNRHKDTEFTNPVLPIESYLTLTDILKCFFEALKYYLKPIQLKGNTIYGTADIKPLIKEAIIDSTRTGTYFLTLLVYYFARRISKTISVKRCLFPYENRSWEKMLLQGFIETSPITRTIGYQHASITKSHTNFVIGREELEILPLPDKILTTGPYVKDWMSLYGNYPKDIIEASCALRQPILTRQTLPERRKPLNHILIVLASSAEEYRETLAFVDTALLQSDNFHVRIRPHPTIPITSTADFGDFRAVIPFSVSTSSLDEDLYWADVVIYCSSTVGIEAIAKGIPVIHVDIGSFIDNDPMFGCAILKWDILKYQDLIPTIKDIETIPDDQFKSIQEAALAYSRDYLTPVDTDLIQKFTGCYP